MMSPPCGIAPLKLRLRKGVIRDDVIELAQMRRLVELFLAELRAVGDEDRRLAHLQKPALKDALALRRHDEEEVLRHGGRADKGEVNAVARELLRRHGTRDGSRLGQDGAA